MATIRKKKHLHRAILVIPLFAGVSQLAVAQAPKGLNIDVERCVALEKPEERLACFEAQVEAARQRPPPIASDATATNPAAIVGAGAVAGNGASEPRTVENFGVPPERSPERERVREPIEIVATVTELRQTVPNAYVITLDNGQVWRQAHPMPYPLRTGLVVRVRETNFGYRLSAPDLHGQINVERVR